MFVKKNRLSFVGIFMVLAGIVGLLVGTGPGTAQAANGLLWGVERWYVWQGYNTTSLSGGTHGGPELDLTVDSTNAHSTGGVKVYAPASGTIGYLGASHGDVRIVIDGTDKCVQLAHLDYDPNLQLNRSINQGDYLGTVAYAGQRNNNGVAHVHMELRQGNCGVSGGYSNIPFTGDWTINGVSLPNTGIVQEHAGAWIDPMVGPPPEPIEGPYRLYEGRFENTSAGISGLSSLIMKVNSNSVSGYMDFSNDPGATTLCGAGQFNGTRSGDTIQFSFSSNDPDAGCGFENGWIFDINGSLSNGENRIAGTYTVQGQTGTFGLDRIHAQLYEGRFTNLSSTTGGPVVIDMAVGRYVTGYMNFSNDPAVGALCGAGEFWTKRNNNNVSYNFSSNDPDPGCGFDNGWIFNVDGSLENNNQVLSGNYSVQGQTGAFQAAIPGPTPTPPPTNPTPIPTSTPQPSATPQPTQTATPQPTGTPTGAVLSINPEQGQGYVGDVIELDIEVNDVSDLYGLETQCQVDPAILSWQSVDFGDFFTDPLNGANNIDADNGAWTGAVSQKNPAPSLSGNGVFATLIFEAVGPGTTTIECDPLASDRDGFKLSILANTAAVTILNASGQMQGEVTYQGRMEHAGIDIDITGPVNDNTQTDVTGGFSITDLQNGVYTVKADANLYLPSCITATISGQNLFELLPTVLAGGDTNDNDKIKIGDATLVSTNFGLTSSSDPLMDSHADINADGRVNIQDLSILGGNFGKVGCQPW